MSKLDLHEAALAGHSMGTGEVARYLGAYGSARVVRGLLVWPIGPFLLQAGDNPEGLPGSVFDGFIQTATADVAAWMTTFLNVFYSTGTQRDASVSDQAFQASWNIASAASAAAAVACIATWETDFRADLRKIDVPVLVVQGDADQAVPFQKTGKRVPAFVNDVQLITVSGGPHTIPWTPRRAGQHRAAAVHRHARRPPVDRAPATTQDSRAIPALKDHDASRRRHRPAAQEVTLSSRSG